MLLAMVCAVGIVAFGRKSPASRLAASMMVIFPLQFTMLLGGWTEPLSVVLLVVVMHGYAWSRASWPIVFGLLLASKLTLLIIGPLVFLLLLTYRLHRRRHDEVIALVKIAGGFLLGMAPAL